MTQDVKAPTLYTKQCMLQVQDILCLKSITLVISPRYLCIGTAGDEAACICFHATFRAQQAW